MLDYGCCLSRILTLLSSIVTLRFITYLTRVVDQPGHYRTQGSSKGCNICRWETWTRWNLFMRKRNNVTLLRKKWGQSQSNRPLSDLSTDLLMMSRNQPWTRATCPLILFIDNSSHMCYAVRMANFNFLAQPIIVTILFSRQNKSSSSTWCQSLSSLNGMVVRVNVSFEKRGVVWIESWLWMICEEDVCWAVGIPPTCSFWHVLAWSKSKGLFHLFYVVIKKK